MTQPETLLVGRIRDAIRDRWPGVYVLKIHGGAAQSGGIPDLVGCVDGRFFAIEVKAPRRGESNTKARERVTVRQAIHLERVLDAGGISGVAVTVDEAIAIIEEGK